jgi:hypothetical protein
MTHTLRVADRDGWARCAYVPPLHATTALRNLR